VVEKRQYIDVNIFIYWLGGHPQYGEKAKKWIENIEKKRGEFITSTLTLYETLIIMAGLTGKTLSDKEFVNDIITSLTSLKNLRFIPLEKEDYTKAIEYINKFKLDLEDAIHYTIAKRSHANTIISNDKDYDKTDIQRKF